MSHFEITLNNIRQSPSSRNPYVCIGDVSPKDAKLRYVIPTTYSLTFTFGDEMDIELWPDNGTFRAYVCDGKIIVDKFGGF